MTLPPSDIISSHRVWFDMLRLRDAIAERRPELRDLLEIPDRTLDRVTVPVRGGRVLAGRAHAGAWPVWIVNDPHLNESGWPAETDTAVLADEFVVRYDRFAGDGPVTPLPSPWRWNQSSVGPAVTLADLLTTSGHNVEGVVGHDRGLGYLSDQGTEFMDVPEIFGDAVRIYLDRATVTLARKPALGWVMDVDDLLTVRRVDMHELLTGATARRPGLLTDDLEQLVTAVGQIEGRLPLPFAEEAGNAMWDAEDPVASGAAWWLRQYGYPGAYTVWTRSEIEVVECDAVTVDIRRVRRTVSMGDVQRSAGVASLLRKPLVLFSVSGFTSSASQWADEAAIMLFSISRDGRHVCSRSALAREHVPAALGGKHVLRPRRLT